LQLSTKAAVMRLAIGTSLKDKKDPRMIDGKLAKYDIKTKDGSDYMRYTIMPSDEILYRVMFEQHLGFQISNDEFFPELVYAHISRGVNKIYSDYRLYRKKEKVFRNLFFDEGGENNAVSR